MQDLEIPKLLMNSRSPKTDAQMPLPVVTGGIGLLLSFVIPGGFTGGQGFVIGAVVGFAILAITAFSETKPTRTRTVGRCPNCDSKLEISTLGLGIAKERSPTTH